MDRLPTMIMPVMVKFWGKMASFNRPEFQTERLSYMVPPPSAVRGMLESIYWKPELHWRVREVWVLNPIRWIGMTRNEVSMTASRTAVAGKFNPLYADRCRLQRHTRSLYDVAYVVVAEPIPNRFTVEEMEKHVHIFNDRVRKGQSEYDVYFGCREYVAYFSMCTGEEKPIPLTLPLGRMTFDQNYVKPGMSYRSHANDTKPVPVYFEARLEGGVLKVPDELYDICGGSRGGDNREQPPLPAWAGSGV